MGKGICIMYVSVHTRRENIIPGPRRMARAPRPPRKKREGRLDLETTGLSLSTGTFEFATLRDGIGLLVLVGAHAEMLDGFPRVPLALQQDGVGTSRCPQSELVKGDSLSAGVEDAFLCSASEPESSNGEFGDNLETDVVCHGSNGDNDFLGGFPALDFLDDTGKRDGGSVDLGEEKTAEDDLVEFGISPTSEEAVKLDEEKEVRILALGRCAVALFDVMVSNIDTHFAPDGVLNSCGCRR